MLAKRSSATPYGSRKAPARRLLHTLHAGTPVRNMVIDSAAVRLNSLADLAGNSGPQPAGSRRPYNNLCGTVPGKETQLLAWRVWRPQWMCSVGRWQYENRQQYAALRIMHDMVCRRVPRHMHARGGGQNIACPASMQKGAHAGAAIWLQAHGCAAFVCVLTSHDRKDAACEDSSQKLCKDVDPVSSHTTVIQLSVTQLSFGFVAGACSLSPTSQFQPQQRSRGAVSA